MTDQEDNPALTDPDRTLPAAAEAPDQSEPPQKGKLEGAANVSLEPPAKITVAKLP